jgi:hypothetical protein
VQKVKHLAAIIDPKLVGQLLRDIQNDALILVDIGSGRRQETHCSRLLRLAWLGTTYISEGCFHSRESGNPDFDAISIDFHLAGMTK